MKLIKIALFAAVLIFESAAAFAGNFADTYGFSAQGIALGNAMTARVNDWSSVYYNMAGLGRTAHLKNTASSEADGKAQADPKNKNKKEEALSKTGDQRIFVNDLAITYLYTIPMLNIDIKRTDNSGNPVPTDGAEIDPYSFIITGLAVDLNYIYKMPSIISSARIGLGMGLNGDLSVVKLNDIDLRTHNFVRYGREAQKATILAGVGFGILNDMIGFGVGANISFSGEGSVLLKKVQMSSDPSTPNGESKMDLKTSPAAVAGIYLRSGQIIPLLEGLDFGITYRQESYMEIYPFKTAALAMDDSIAMQMLVVIMDYYTPDTYIFGAAYTRWGVTLSADVEYQNWSKFRVNVAHNANYKFLPKYEDIFIYRLGAEWQMNSWISLMGGGYYQPSFISDSSAKSEFNLLDNDKYVGSAGARFALPQMLGFGGPVEITAAYQMQYLAEKSVKKNAPTSYNPDYKYGGTNHSILLGLVLKL